MLRPKIDVRGSCLFLLLLIIFFWGCIILFSIRYGNRFSVCGTNNFCLGH
jgi:hypothetical protein